MSDVSKICDTLYGAGECELDWKNKTQTIDHSYPIPDGPAVERNSDQ